MAALRRGLRALSTTHRDWRSARTATAERVLEELGAFDGRDRFETFARRWAAADDEEALYEAEGQTLRARGDYPGLECRAVRGRPSWADALEAAAPEIAAEYTRAAPAHEPFFGGEYGASYDGVPLAACGAAVDGAEGAFPRTLAALRRVHAGEGESDALLGGTRLAFFARQGPRSNVEPHSDLCNFLLTGHLGLDVPDDGECALFFMDPASPPVRWERNTLAPLLQTSFRHAAVNDSDRPRAILYFDFFHPDLRPGERRALLAFERARRDDEAAFFR